MYTTISAEEKYIDICICISLCDVGQGGGWLLWMIGAAEVAVLHHEELVDGIVHGRVQALREARHLLAAAATRCVGVGARATATGALVAAVGPGAALAVADLEGRLGAVDRYVAAAVALARVARVRV